MEKTEVPQVAKPLNFDPAPPRTPADIGEIIIHVVYNPSNTERTHAVDYSLQVLDQDGDSLSSRSGDLLPRLDVAEKQQLRAIVERIHALAKTKIIGG